MNTVKIANIAVISPEAFESIADAVAAGAVVNVTEVKVISFEEFDAMFPEVNEDEIESI